MFLYDLLLVMIGIFIGVIAADPIKKLFTGGYKEEMKQKKRVRLLLYLREEAKSEKVSTKELSNAVFKGKENTEAVYSLLKDIEETGLIKRTDGKASDKEEIRWYFNRKKYEEQKSNR